MSEPPPDPKPPTLALVGRPNSGKSSMYNRLTGGDAHVGNFPGITVDILEDFVDVPGVGRTCVLDVPGLYTFEASVDASTDEGIARDFLLGLESSGERYVIAQVADSTQLGLALRRARDDLARGEAQAQRADVARAERAELVVALAVHVRRDHPTERDELRPWRRADEPPAAQEQAVEFPQREAGLGAQQARARVPLQDPVGEPRADDLALRRRRQRRVAVRAPEPAAEHRAAGGLLEVLGQQLAPGHRQVAPPGQRRLSAVAHAAGV